MKKALLILFFSILIYSCKKEENDHSMDYHHVEIQKIFLEQYVDEYYNSNLVYEPWDTNGLPDCFLKINSWVNSSENYQSETINECTNYSEHEFVKNLPITISYRADEGYSDYYLFDRDSLTNTSMGDYNIDWIWFSEFSKNDTIRKVDYNGGYQTKLIMIVKWID